MRSVRRRMADHGISQAELARRSGIEAPNICAYMRGRVKPSLRTMLVLDEALSELINEA
jgi:transcriptional regulator with XRE-family HTH domain